MPTTTHTILAPQAPLTVNVPGDTGIGGGEPIAQRNTLRLLGPGGLAYPSTDVIPRSFTLDTESWRLRFTA